MNLKHVIAIGAAELWNALRRPSRILKVINRNRVRRFIDFQRARIRSIESWTPESTESALARRQVRSYDDYLELQASKLQFIDLGSHEERFRRALAERLSDLSFVTAGSTVVCLAARLGGEVRAFRDLGLFAVGVDLNPGPKNDAVLYGDFHNLQFPEHSTSIVYSNSLDHAFGLEQVFSEIRRILKANGRVIIEADPGTEEGEQVAPDIWQTLAWKRVDDLVAKIEGLGFHLEGRRRYQYPRGGEQLIFLPSDDERGSSSP